MFKLCLILAHNILNAAMQQKLLLLKLVWRNSRKNILKKIFKKRILLNFLVIFLVFSGDPELY